MLALAFAAVAVYVGELAGVWAWAGMEQPYHAIAVALDLAFVVDLALKVGLGRAAYVRSPWAIVDVVCTAPVLASLSVAPTALYGLRFLRAFRAFRVLRVLRGLRSLALLRLALRDAETVEQRRFDRVLASSVAVYAAVFVALAAFGRSTWAAERIDPTNSRELYLVVGSLLGMAIVLLVARFHIPAIWSQQMRALLNVALPVQVADWLMKNPDAYDHTERGPATVMFCDIKGFTATVEHLALDDVKAHLERALDAVVDAHVAHDLIIDKYIGDAVMSFRGGTLVTGDPTVHARLVVHAALAGAAALRALGDPWFREIKIGGASATDALIGTFGTSKRLSYTILGDRVNLAARFEAACSGLGVRNLWCDRTRALLIDDAALAWRRVGAVRVHGKEEAVTAWEVFERSSEDLRWLDVFHGALAAFERRAFAEAHAAFSDVLAMRVDGPSAAYVTLCAAHLDQPPGDDWLPVLLTRK